MANITGVRFKKAGKVYYFDAGDIEDGDGAAIGIDLVGVSSHYFAGLMLPSESREYESRFNKQSLELKDENGDGKKRDYISAALVARGIPATFNLFLGPKEHDRLAALGPGIEKAIDYGSWMRMPVNVEGLVGNDDAFPHVDVIVLELGNALGLRFVSGLNGET